MVQRVFLQCRKSKFLSHIVIATDHPKIAEHVKSFGGDVAMTGEHHPSGTDRCQEALQLQSAPYDFVVNIQGDEPFIDPKQIDLLCASLDTSTELATLIQKITTLHQLTSPHEAKVVLNDNGDALYFSRSPIPYVQKAEMSQWLDKAIFYRHVGLYAYRSDILAKITKLPVSPLEQAESLEQLRWLEHGFRIKTVETDSEEGLCIDTPEDLEKAKAHLLRLTH